MASTAEHTEHLSRLHSFNLPWDALFDNPDFPEAFCQDILEPYIHKQRWYAGKSSALKYIELLDYY